MVRKIPTHPVIFAFFYTVVFCVALMLLVNHMRIRVREEEWRKKRIEDIIRKTQESGDQVMGLIRVMEDWQWVGWPYGASRSHQVLVISPSGISVEWIEEYAKLKYFTTASPWSYSLTIPRSEILKVELNQSGKEIKVSVMTSKKEYKWQAKGLIPEEESVKLEDYKNILQQAFPDRLSVRK